MDGSALLLRCFQSFSNVQRISISSHLSAIFSNFALSHSFSLIFIIKYRVKMKGSRLQLNRTVKQTGRRLCVAFFRVSPRVAFATALDFFLMNVCPFIFQKAAAVTTKTRIQCHQHWNRVIKPSIKKGSWTGALQAQQVLATFPCWYHCSQKLPSVFVSLEFYRRRR